MLLRPADYRPTRTHGTPATEEADLKLALGVIFRRLKAMNIPPSKLTDDTWSADVEGIAWDCADSVLNSWQPIHFEPMD